MNSFDSLTSKQRATWIAFLEGRLEKVRLSPNRKPKLVLKGRKVR